MAVGCHWLEIIPTKQTHLVFQPAMILTFCFFTLLVATNTGAQRIKGGPRIIQQEPAIQEPHIHVGKGGGGGARLHHTAVVADPISANPVIVEKVTDLGPSSGQFSISDSQIPSFGARRLYRVGASQVPFGLSGLDYYSYPRSLLSGRRVISRKTVASDNVSGLSPIGFGGRKSAIIADPTTSQFSIGDAQIRTSAFGGRGLYRTGVSSVPYGLSGLDYYSYPRTLLTSGGGLLGGGLGGGLGQTQILSGGGFSAGDAQVNALVGDPIGQERVSIIESAPQQEEVTTTIVEDGGFGQRQVTTVSRPAGGFGGLRGGQIILRGGQGAGLRRVKSRPIIQAAAPIQEEVQVLVDSTSGLGAPIGGFGQRQVVTKTVAAPAPAPVIVRQVQAPAPVIVRQVQQAPAPVIVRQVQQAPVFHAPAPIRRRLGEAFLTQAARPLVAARRIATIARPVSIQQAPAFPGHIQFSLGGNQIIGGSSFGGPSFGGSSFGGSSFGAAPAVFSAPRQVVVSAPAPRQVIVSAPAPRQVVVQRPVAVQQPVISQVKTSGGGFGARRIFGRQFPTMYYVDGGSRFPGIDIIGGYRIGDPRHNYGRLPISTSRFANLGLNQASIDAGPILVSPAASPVFGAKTVSSPVAKTAIGGANALGLTAVGHTSPTKIVTQEEVIGPSGDSQIITTVQDSGPSKIGGPVIGGGLSGVGQTKTITQEEVIGPAGDSQILTTVTKSGPSKIGGVATGGALGLTAVGQGAPTQVVTQEEVIGPSGDSQILTTVTNTGPSKIGGPVVASPLGLSAVGKTSPAKVVTQEEVIGPAGDRQVITTVSDAGPSKIGGAALGGPLGLSGVGQSGVTKTVTQEEVIGPAGDSQIVTTVTETASGPSKIGGVASHPLGLTAVGQAPTKVITQEEVVGPSGDSQIITTVSKTSQPNIVQQEEVGFSSLTASPLSQEISQGPIEAALSQETLGDSGIISSGGSSLLSPFSQSSIDHIGSGQTQLSIDDVLGSGTGGGQVVQETTYTEPTQLSDGSIGTTVTKVREISQQPITQQSVSSGFEGGLGGGYVPRVSFLSQFPYDVPDRALLRQALTRPIVQEQQQLEQILV